MDNEEFEKRLNKEKSFINTSKNHTAELEKQLKEQVEEHKVRDEIEERKERLFSEDSDDILTSDGSSSGIGGLVPAFIGILVAVIVGMGVVIPVITDTIGETNITSILGSGEIGGTIIDMLPIMIGLVLLVGIVSLVITMRG